MDTPPPSLVETALLDLDRHAPCCVGQRWLLRKKSARKKKGGDLHLDQLSIPTARPFEKE